MTVYNWSSDAFEDCYDLIKLQDVGYYEAIQAIKTDLLNVLVTPAKNEKSRNILIDETKPIQFGSGDEFKLNRPFIEICTVLATELDLDEVCVAELVYFANSLSFQRGTNLIDSAKLAYFSRLKYILNILGYLITNQELHLIFDQEQEQVTSQQYETLFNNIIQSFQRIYTLLNTINDLIDKQKVTNDINNLSFINSINFVKSQLLLDHEVLGQLLYSLFDNYFDKFTSPLAIFKSLIQFIKEKINDNDILIIHFIPGTLKLISNLFIPSYNIKDSTIEEFYKFIISTLEIDYNSIADANNEIDLSKSKLKGIDMITDLVFLTLFIPWCKELESRTAKYDFKDDILKFMELLINYGAFETLLSYTADTSNVKSENLFERSNTYDFRALLQKVFPRLAPSKFTYNSSQELLYTSLTKSGYENISVLLETNQYKVSPEFNETLVAPFFHLFFSNFITNAAIILTSLRDTEEDFLLSSINGKQDANDEPPSTTSASSSNSTKNDQKNDGLDLDEIAARGDLERFYLAFAYTYNYRPELCNMFWSDDVSSNDVNGFIAWGLSNNTSSLITATFCLLLGSLTSGGNNLSSQIWETLIQNNSSGLKKSDYSKISIDSICDSLNYYIDSLQENFELDLNEQLRQQQKKHEFRFSSVSNKKDLDDNSENRIVIELAEDSVVFISGFFQLISSIVKHLSSSSNERSKEIKNIAFNRFLPIITGFLKFDNLITGGSLLTVLESSNKSVDLPKVLVSEENRIVLTNLLLNFLTSFVHDQDSDLDIRYRIWRLIDSWIYHGLHIESSSNTNNNSSSTGLNSQSSLLLVRQNQTKPKYSAKGNLRILQGFDINLVHLSQVNNFVELINRLLKPLSNENQAFSPYYLLYPADLGSGYRINNQIGIWPYIEYLLVGVFSKVGEISNFDDRLYLQLSIVETIQTSLKSVDWKFISDTVHQVIRNFPVGDSIFNSFLPNVNLNYELFVKLHHSVAILNYLFNEKTWAALFGIANSGVENISSNYNLSILVESSLKVLDDILSVEDIFVKNLLPILKSKDISPPTSGTVGFSTSLTLALASPKTVFDNIYYPTNIGTNAVGDFSEVFLFNLATVAHLGLYVGIKESNIATISISILDKIRTSKYFLSKSGYSSNDSLLNKNRLLTTFESIDESEKIKYAFISVFENVDQNLSLKYRILEFLSANLNQSSGKEPNVAHFLLGYVIRGGSLILDETTQTNSLLKSLLETLSLTLDVISQTDYTNGNYQNIDVGPVKLSSLILEIVIKLSHDPISSIITIGNLREQDNLFEKLIQYQPKLDLNTLWSGVVFNGDLRDGVENYFVENDDSNQAFFSFISQRNLILQYLSLEFHHISSRSKREYYMELLLDNKEYLSGTPKVLGLLDVLNYEFKNFELYKFETFNKKYNLSLILQTVQAEDLDLSILNKIYKFICQSSSNLSTREDKIQFAQQVMIEGNKINDFIRKYIVSVKLKDIQLKSLHSWCQLVEILITDHNLYSKKFILEILQVILPKINDYLESDIAFSEELISLTVLLFDLYDQKIVIETNSKEDFALGIRRLIPLLKTCIAGILNSNSTPSLRSDLYVLTNKFLIKVINNEDLAQETSAIIKSIDKKLIEIISSDAIYSEGASRITSILLLESLIHLGKQDNFVLDLLVKNNSLLLLMRSIKRTDEVLEICDGSTGDHKKSGISLETFIYELTAFKSTLYFLIRVAQSKAGSLQLIQGEIFSLLKQSNLLSIDPDLGINLKIDEYQDLKNIKVSLLLDTPIGIISDLNTLKKTTASNRDNTISYIEFIIPIFQLIVTILLAMGPSYKPSILESRKLLSSVDRLVVGVLKRDLLLENQNPEVYKNKDSQYEGLKELVKLFTLLESLVKYNESG
ncbi:nucleoporin Nup186/Nup192/Nup205 [Scheffersomyces coipomensis]|uniref:nucleoporin Nup186/Nup192/Nup205 n=1 Tax=Scheffersomyces coipomensis TaxID=1788519 RepID=UPI00315E0092